MDEVKKIELDSVVTNDDWVDMHGQPLLDFISGQNKVYCCVAERRGFLDMQRGFADSMLRDMYLHMKKGFSYESFGAKYMLTNARKKLFENTIIEWKIVKEMGLLAQREKWEGIGIDLAEGNLEKGNASVYIATMKALFRDTYGDLKEVRHELNHSGKVEIKVIERKGTVPLLRNDETFTEAKVIE